MKQVAPQITTVLLELKTRTERMSFQSPVCQTLCNNGSPFFCESVSLILFLRVLPLQLLQLECILYFLLLSFAKELLDLCQLLKLKSLNTFSLKLLPVSSYCLGLIFITTKANTHASRWQDRSFFYSSLFSRLAHRSCWWPTELTTLPPPGGLGRTSEQCTQTWHWPAW